MYCSNCGTELREGNAFCPNCGQPVSRTSQSSAGQDNGPESYPYGSRSAGQQRSPEPEPYQYGGEAQGSDRQSGGSERYQYGSPNQYESGNGYNGDNNYQYRQPAQQNADGFAIASLVLGIVAFFLLPIIGGILAIVFGNKSIRENGMNTMARVGRILGIVALILYIIVIVILIAVIAVVGVGAMNGYYYYF